MTNVGVAFEVIDESRPPGQPPGQTKVTGHMVYDVKMDFTRKAPWNLDSHLTPNVTYSTYASVVSGNSVCMTLTCAALNGLEVCAPDITPNIHNAYIQAPSSQKNYVICGPEIGLQNVGKVALIHRALYGGKRAGRDFRNHLRSCIWMGLALTADGQEVWEYMLLYTDDVLCIGPSPVKTLREDIGKYFELKQESIGPPT